MKSIPGNLSRSKGQPVAADGPLSAGRPGFAATHALVMLALLGCLLWAYWPTLAGMWERWSTDPQYSHGFLVPVFALVVLWSRHERRPSTLAPPSRWGWALLAAAVLLRFSAAYFYLPALDGLSLLPLVAGMVLLLGGGPALRWSWPAIAFLGFMLPLPYQVEMALAQPLRNLATTASTYALQTIGYPALAEGNTIVIDDVRLGVIDACSGLGMLFTFFALATAVALIINRPLLDRIVVIASAIPIALVVNVIRITLTGVAHLTLGPEVGNALMHDFAGWLMMPLALGLLWLELWYVSRLLVAVARAAPLPVSLAGVGPSPGPVRQPETPWRSVHDASRQAAEPAVHPAAHD